jgi:predicted ferric reductase
MKGRPPGWINPGALFLVYSLLALTPLGLAWIQDLPRRPLLDELSSALAAVGFAMLLMEFVISGRFEGVSGRLGIDRAIRFHKLTARVLTAFILVHPFLYTLPTGKKLPWDSSAQFTLGLTGPPLLAGMLAWIALPALVLWAMFHREFPYKYETWRACHGIGALLIALLAFAHTVGAGRYSTHGALFWFWVVLVSVGGLTLTQVYLWRPLAQRRRPYRVVSVAPIARKTWELMIEPEHGDALDFEAGQFVWLNISRSPFSLKEHPFSMSTCPDQRPRIGFAIKEVGDFTSTVGSIPVGARAYLDGPHGNLNLAGRDSEGVVFIAGGVGMAPIMSILRQMVRDGDKRPCLLIYGNRATDQIMYRSELEQIAASLSLCMHHVLSEPPIGWSEQTGQLDHHTLGRVLDAERTALWLHLVCGPEPMIESVERTLKRLGVPPAKILSERFT